jgi:hypothetical protein
MCAPVNAIPPALLLPAIPANFRDWPACMQRRYREHALALSSDPVNAAVVLESPPIKATRRTQDLVSSARS